MGVGADRNDFAAQFFVASQDGGAGIGFPQAVKESAGVELDSFAVLKQFGQDLVEYILILFIGIPWSFCGP